MSLRYMLPAHGRCLQISLSAMIFLGVVISCSSDEAPSVPFEIQSFGPAPSFDEAIADPSPTVSVVRKVLFIAVDGLRASKVDNTDGNTLTIPNFERMQADGVFVLESHQERMPDGKYQTCPGFIQMMTGKRIQTHGVRNNGECDEGNYEDYPVFFKRLKQMRPNIRIAAADPTSSVGKIIVESCGTIPVQCLDAFLAFDQTYAGDVAGRDQIIGWMDDGRFDVLWYHPHEVDARGHDSGWDDDPINNMVERFDEEIIGPLLEAVARREVSTSERWLIVTSADHGGHNEWWWWGGDHNTQDRDKKVPIIISGSLIPNQGAQPVNAFRTWDLPATIYEYLNLLPNPSWPPTDGVSILSR